MCSVDSVAIFRRAFSSEYAVVSNSTPDSVSIKAHAKINLFLRVLSRETTGFHGIETLFALLELADDISVERTSGGIDIEVEGADTGPTDENLAVRAARAVLGASGDRFGVRIHLKKNIPVRAGLGGGSSDAAAPEAVKNSRARSTMASRGSDRM